MCHIFLYYRGDLIQTCRLCTAMEDESKEGSQGKPPISAPLDTSIPAVVETVADDLHSGEGSTVTRISEFGEHLSMSQLLSEPIGMSFDSNTSAESCDFQIAEGCDMSTKIMEAFFDHSMEEKSRATTTSLCKQWSEGESCQVISNLSVYLYLSVLSNLYACSMGLSSCTRLCCVTTGRLRASASGKSSASGPMARMTCRLVDSLKKMHKLLQMLTQAGTVSTRRCCVPCGQREHVSTGPIVCLHMAWQS